MQAGREGEREGEGRGGGGGDVVEDGARKQDHLLAISIVRIRCESVTVNKTLASTTADAFT